MTWSYLKRTISTDQQTLLWNMHQNYVTHVKNKCCNVVEPKMEYMNMDNKNKNMPYTEIKDIKELVR